MLSKEEADDLLTPYKERIARAIAVAWGEYTEEYSADVRRKLTTRTRANVVHDHVQHQIRAGFGTDPDARPYTRRNGFYLSIYGRLRLRFKKLDQDLRTRNILTRNVFAFLHQLDLPGASEAITNLHAGYRLNELQTAIQGIFITCPDGRRNRWVIELDPGMWSSGTGGAQVVPLAPPPGSPTDARAVPTVRPKVGRDVDSGSDE